MTKPNFQITYYLWLARKDKSGLYPVYLISNQNSRKKIFYNTGLKLSPHQWNKKKNEPTNKPAILLDLEARLQATYKYLRDQGHEPTLKDLVEVKAPSKIETLTEWCDDYLKGEYSEGQKHAMRTLKSNLEGFVSLTFDKLTRPRIKAFFEYLTKKGVANNSQYKRLASLKNLAEHANNPAPELKSFEIQYPTLNTNKVRLTWAEVKRVMNTPTREGIAQIAKDVFLLACFSGLRIDDILTLQKGKLTEYYYERTQGKTEVPVMVTIHKYNQDLFKKHIGGVRYSRQKLSQALKPTLKEAGLTEKVIKVQRVGYGKKETVLEKWQEIAFHSGRRFYARLLNDLGLGNEIARDELGHSYKSVTELYAGSQEHNHRIARVRKAMERLEKTLEELSLMKVA